MNLSPTFSIGDFEIGGDKTFVIAEIGSNHNQSLDLAKESIEAASKAGADAVKFQSIDLDALYHQPSESTQELHRRIDLEESWHGELAVEARQNDVQFFSTPTYLRSIDILESLDVRMYKLASAQIGTFPQLVRKVAEQNKPTILSTGLATLGTLEEMVKIFLEAKNFQIAILHCNSIYPTPPHRVFLDHMIRYGQLFGCPVGFSDHTTGMAVAIAAVAKGAKVIEKHFTLDRSLPVPDASFSLDPLAFTEMVQGIREAEDCCRRQAPLRIALEPEEQNFQTQIRTRVFAARALPQGHRLVHEDLMFRRYTEGLDARQMFDFMKGSVHLERSVDSGALLNAADLRLEAE